MSARVVRARHSRSLPTYNAFFLWEVRIREKKGVILQAWVREILKKGKVLHVFITICLFHMFELLCINVFEL